MIDFHNLLTIMVVVWVMGKVFRYLKLPVVFGELIGGVLVGPLVLNIVDPNDTTIQVLADLGIFFMMLHAGLETDPNQLIEKSKRSFAVSFGAVFASVLAGFGVSKLFGLTGEQAMFVAVTVSATAVAISVRILKEYKMHNTSIGKTVLGAAIVSDITVLVLFSIAINYIQSGGLNLEAAALLLFKIVLFFAVVIFGGFKVQKYLNVFLKDKGFTFTLIVALALGFIAELIGLHIVIGAFLAGLFIRQELIDDKVFKKIEDRIYGLSYSFLGPIFFANLAVFLDFSGIKSNFKFFIALVLVVMVAKFLGAFLGSLSQKVQAKKAAVIAVSMNTLGAVDLIIASIGLQSGIISQEIFSVLVVLVFATTLITIVILKPIKTLLKTD